MDSALQAGRGSPQSTVYPLSGDGQPQNESSSKRKVSQLEEGQSGQIPDSDPCSDVKRRKGQDKTITDLPVDVIEKIGVYLTPKDKGCMKMTCPYFNAVFSKEELRERVTQYYTRDKSIRDVHRQNAATLFNVDNELIVNWLERQSFCEETKGWIKQDPLHMAAAFRKQSNQKLSAFDTGGMSPLVLKSCQQIKWSDGILKVQDLFQASSSKTERTLDHKAKPEGVVELQGNRVCSWSRENKQITVKAWDLSQDPGRELEGTRVIDVGDFWVHVVELSDRRLAFCCGGGTIKILDFSQKTDVECVRTLKGHKRRVKSVIKRQDENLVSCSEDGTLKIWDLSQKLGKECVKTLADHGKCVELVIEMQDKRLASLDTHGVLKIWDPSQAYPWYCVKTIESYDYAPCSHLAEISGKRLASCSVKGRIRVWEPFKTGKWCERLYSTRLTGVRKITRAPDGRLLLLYRGNDKLIVDIWDMDMRVPGSVGEVTIDTKKIEAAHSAKYDSETEMLIFDEIPTVYEFLSSL